MQNYFNWQFLGVQPCTPLEVILNGFCSWIRWWYVYCMQRPHKLVMPNWIELFIIPLRPYLENIKGCRRPDIFRIRPWARHSRIVSGSECVSLCRCTRITARFPPHARIRSCIFRVTEAGLNNLFCLFLCLLAARFVGSKSSHFAV